MQIAKLFASLGFKIDTADLSHFESLLNKAQGEMSQFAKDLNFVNQKLKTMKTRFGQANDALKDTDISKAADRVAKAVDKYVKNAKEIVDIDSKVEKVFLDTGVRLDTLSNKLDGGTAAWNRYEQQVKEATTRMREFTAAARERQSVNPPRSTNAGSGSNQGGSRGGSRGNNGYNDEEEGFGAMLLGGQKFGKAFVGQMALGGALGSGYIVKEIVQTGREVQKMEQMLLQASKSAEDFQNNLAFTKETSAALAVDFTEFGVAYSKILNATERSILTQKQKEDIVFGFAKYMRTINLSSPDQAGVFRQLGQMFNTGRIQQDEINSMSDRGIAMNKFLRMAAEELGISGDDYTKMQEAGKADPIKLIPIVSRMLADAADNNNAFSKSLTTSLAKQQAFTNAMKEFAATVLKSGLDQGLANMSSALEKIVIVLTPMVVGLMSAIGGVIGVIKLLLGVDWKIYAGIAVAALLVVTAQMWLLSTSAAVAAAYTKGLAVAMGLLSRAFPIAGLITLIGLLGVYRREQEELANGTQTYTWIDLWIERLTFFFLIMRKGWLTADIAISNSILKLREFFTITPPKWFSDFIERRNSKPDFQRQIKIMEDQMKEANSGAMLTPSSFGDKKSNLTVPVEVFLTIQNPDGTSRAERVTGMSTINIGNIAYV